MSNLGAKFPHSILGYKIHTSDLLTVEGPPVEVPRTAKERWRSWPWRPWKKTKWVPSRLPSREVLRMPDGSLMMHPVIFKEMLDTLTANARTSLATQNDQTILREISKGSGVTFTN